MITTIILLAGLATAGYLLYKNKQQIVSSRGDIKHFVMPAGIILITIFALFINPFEVERVDASNVGFKINLTGDERGLSNYQYKTGWVVYCTWVEQFREVPINQRHMEYSPQQIITKGGFSATVQPTFNYKVIPQQAGDMYIELRVPLAEIEQGWLKTAVLGSINNVANRWYVDSIFNHREAFETEIINECNKHVSRWFVLSQLRTNIVPPPSLQKSIDAKTDAIQKEQVAQSNQRTAMAQALEKIAIARGDSAQAVIAASGEAEAIKRKQLTLTNMYIEYMKVEKWNGQNSQTVLGNTNGTMVNIK